MGAAVSKRILEQPSRRHLRRRRDGGAALQLARQVRVRHRLAELRSATGTGKRRNSRRPDARNGPRRGPLEAWQLTPWPPLRRRASPDGTALLHELSVIAVRSGREAGRRGVWRIPKTL